MAKDPSPYGPLHASAPSHRKVFALAESMRIPQPYAFGLVCTLWARSLVEAPDGIVRGGERRLASLAGWDGDPDVFAAALVGAGYVSADGTSFRIHDWESYGGRSLKELSTKKASMEKARKTRWSGQGSGYQCTDNSGQKQCTDVSAPLLSSDPDHDPDPDLIAQHVPTREREAEPQAEPTRPEPRIPRKYTGSGGIGGFEAQMSRGSWATTPQQIIERYGGAWSSDYPQLDGRSPRLSLLQSVAAHWPWFQRARMASGKEPEIVAQLVKYIADDASKASWTWQRDGCPGPQQPASTKPPGKRPLAEGEEDTDDSS